MKRQFYELALAAADLLFPPACLACDTRLSGSRGPLFCPACMDDLHLIRQPLCPSCGRSYPAVAGGNHLCSRCLKKPWHFEAARAVLLYTETVSRAVQSFKYGGSTVGLKSFRMLHNALPGHEDWAAADLILPVPLHVKRLRQRGFNQALRLARALFPDQKSKIDPFLLERSRWTVPQTGLSGAERRRNLKQAFRVRQPERLQGKEILLVDDIFTTGSTVNECARVLLRGGARRVRVLTLARVRED
jgi:ComF family protein